MGDKEWSKLWEMSERDLLEVWGLSKEELEVVPFCQHLAECSKEDCVCGDCRMYAALTDNGSRGTGQRRCIALGCRRLGTLSVL